MLLLFLFQPANALPQFALTAGNRCITCHITHQGSGLRDELGRYSMDGVGLLDPERRFGESNAFLDGQVLLGGDARVQMARSHQSPNADRRVFPMQAAVYGAYRPNLRFQLESSHNFGPKKYDGQESWTASALLQPSFSLPRLRIGYFQPSIGIRYDDHTMLVRQIADVIGATPLIAPNLAEFGAEVHFYRLKWLSLTGGVYSARNLAENRVFNPAGQQTSLIEDRDHPSLLGRVVFWPRLRKSRLNAYLGGSYLKNKDVSLTNLFAGLGLQDRLSIMAEYARSNKENIRKTRNFTVDVGYQLLAALILNVRGEHAVSTLYRSGGVETDRVTRQAVFGGQLFLLSQVELRPEYRLMDTETFRSGRYALQLHAYY